MSGDVDEYSMGHKVMIPDQRNHSHLSDSRLIDLPLIADPRGRLTFIEGGGHVPFEIKRIFFLYGIPEGAERGAHAHKDLHQLLIAINGSFTVTLDDGLEKRSFRLSEPHKGLYIHPGLWGDMTDFRDNGICLTLASEHYSELDYIRDYDEFLEYVKRRRNY